MDESALALLVESEAVSRQEEYLTGFNPKVEIWWFRALKRKLKSLIFLVQYKGLNSFLN
jgi:hypothetical protein